MFILIANLYQILHVKPNTYFRTFGSKKLQKITLTGVGDAFTKHSTSSAESKGVKAHFRMDESGILLFEKVCIVIV